MNIKKFFPDLVKTPRYFNIGKIHLFCADFRYMIYSIPPNSIDLVFTDPPYKKDTLDFYSIMASETARILKPSGFACFYCGGYWKENVIIRLSEHLRYFYDFIMIHREKSPLLWQRLVISKYTSILCYTLNNIKPTHPVLGAYTGSGSDKVFHPWQQDESTAGYYIESLSGPNDIILDPFAGSGTFGIVARAFNRQYIGIESDFETFKKACDRISNQNVIDSNSQFTLPFSQ